MKFKNLSFFFCTLVLLAVTLSSCQKQQNPTETYSPVETTQDNTSDTFIETETGSTPLEIISIGCFSEGLAPINTNIGWGYINTHGDIVIDPVYQSAGIFFNSLARVKKADKYGYIDTSGTFVIDAIYDTASEVFNEISIVKRNGITQYINTEGTVIYTMTGREVSIGEIYNGYFWIETKRELISGNVHTITYYDYEGEVFSVDNASNAGESSFINEFGYGFIKVGNHNQLFQIKNDRSYKLFDLLSALSHINNNYCYNTKTDKYIYLDHPSSSFWTTPAGIFSSDLEYLGNEYYYCEFGDIFSHDNYGSGHGIIYKDTLLISLDDINAFSDASIESIGHMNYNGTNYFSIQLLSKSNVMFCSLIDDSGKIIIPPTKEYSFYFVYLDNKYYNYDLLNRSYFPSISAGLLKVIDNTTKKYGFVDMNGNWVISPRYQNATDFYGDGDDAVAVVNGDTVINRKGEVIFSTHGQN